MGKDGSVSVEEQTAKGRRHTGEYRCRGLAGRGFGLVEWYGGCSSNCIVGRARTRLAGSVICSIWCMTRRFLIHAWERVRSNDGARTAGIDGHTVAQIETRVGVHAFLGQVRDLLKSGEYRPSPVRRVKIPKGGGKLRSLGIPTVAS